MTIISTVYVPDGIAMSADSRLTRTMNLEDGTKELFTLSDSAQKIVLLRNETIGVSACGDAIIDGKTVSDLLRIFDINEVKADDTVEQVSINLKKYMEEKYHMYNIFFHVSGFDNDEAFVYDVSKNNVSRRNYDNDEKGIIYGAVWRGESEPTSKLLKDTPLNFDIMPLKDAIDFSEFIVDLTINYCRFQSGLSTCGGPIDILVITKDYTKFLKHKIL
ncbi:hypothetical protein ACO1DB_27655 [Bacillus cereus]|uniref:hypothetical protein n=1 Tax=Bacillus cereus TaxID=1396 RepID=UPI0029596ACB|nr:hypothetical protein [Bacillus sp. BAU-SS-2023]